MVTACARPLVSVPVLLRAPLDGKICRQSTGGSNPPGSWWSRTYRLEPIPGQPSRRERAWEPPGSGFLTQAVGGDGPKVEGVRASRGAGSPQRGIVGQPRRLVRAARGAEQLLAARPRQVNINR